MHIGLIGGIGPAATNYYYQALVREHSSMGRRMNLTVAHAHMAELIDNMSNDLPAQQAQAFLALADQLKAAGAELLAITSIAGHFCIKDFAPISPLPIVNAIPQLAAELAERNCFRIGLLGTQVVMNSRLYGGLEAFDVVIPKGDDLTTTHEQYLAMAAAGVASNEQRQILFSIGQALCTDQGAEIVVLAGTDLFLAFDGHDCGFPVLDSADVHIKGIFRASLTDS